MTGLGMTRAPKSGHSALPAAQVASVLLDLELEGVLVRHAGARVALG